MTKKPSRLIRAGDPRARCAWCRGPIAQPPGRGRPRRFCSQACRQWDWVARARASELQLSEDELVVARREVEALRDGLWLLRCAVDEARGDLESEGSQGAARPATVLRSLLRAANEVLDGTGTPAAPTRSGPRRRRRL